jgi:hypothetical protein
MVHISSYVSQFSMKQSYLLFDFYNITCFDKLTPFFIFRYLQDTLRCNLRSLFSNFFIVTQPTFSTKTEFSLTLSFDVSLYKEGFKY